MVIIPVHKRYLKAIVIGESLHKIDTGESATDNHNSFYQLIHISKRLVHYFCKPCKAPAAKQLVTDQPWNPASIVCIADTRTRVNLRSIADVPCAAKRRYAAQ